MACPGVTMSSMGGEDKSFWKADDTSSKCENKSCEATFSLFKRRSHCRRCGGIYCKSCVTDADCAGLEGAVKLCAGCQTLPPLDDPPAPPERPIQTSCSAMMDVSFSVAMPRPGFAPGEIGEATLIHGHPTRRMNPAEYEIILHLRKRDDNKRKRFVVCRGGSAGGPNTNIVAVLRFQVPDGASAQECFRTGVVEFKWSGLGANSTTLQLPYFIMEQRAVQAQSEQQQQQYQPHTYPAQQVGYPPQYAPPQQPYPQPPSHLYAPLMHSTHQGVVAAPGATTHVPGAHGSQVPSVDTAVDFFLSYRIEESRAFVHRLADALTQRGFTSFVGESVMKGGCDWTQTINAAIISCKVFVPILTKTYGDPVNSPWTKREFDGADSMHKRIIPVMLREDKSLPEALFIQLTALQWIDGRDKDANGSVVHELLSQSGLQTVNQTQDNSSDVAPQVE